MKLDPSRVPAVYFLQWRVVEPLATVVQALRACALGIALFVVVKLKDTFLIARGRMASNIKFPPAKPVAKFE